ncbi:MAG: 2OG-Fe(II) oxygenase [Candidatus Woesearchaeota archaeon]|nr:2OG-Fe(II) oxygenase [Candidatus Woesearchaeota archaeon]
MQSWINPRYLDASVIVCEQEPFPHVSLQEFLLPERAEELRTALLQQEFKKKQADLFSFAQTPDLLTVENPLIRSFLDMIDSKEFHTWMEHVTGVQTTSIDAFGALYGDCDYLLCHDDVVEGRNIAYILNLGKDFTEESGGALALLDCDVQGRPKNVVKRLVPAFNSFNFFVVSEKSHHMVEEILEEKERYSIGGWLRD